MQKKLICGLTGISAMLASTIGIATTFGPVENFDVVNDTGKTAHGFEIELHDLRKSEITSIFGDATRWPNMERYGSPTVTEYADPTATRTQTSTRVTYRATYNAAWSAGTPSGTLPVSPSDSCWPYGAPNYGPNYPCDHFGVSSSVPAAGVKYSWLVESSPGSSNLVYQDSGVPAPAWTVVPQPPVNNQPQPPKVNVVIAAPKPNYYEFGEPRWVKVTATGTLNNVAVEDLVAENNVIQDAINNPNKVQNAATQTQTEWQLLQTDSGNPAAGQIDLTGVALDPGATGVVYRFEFYKFTGNRDPETNEAKPVNGDTAPPVVTDLGPFIVAQMAGVNFDGQVPPAPPLPLAPSIDASISDAVINVPYSATITAAPGNAGDTLAYAVTGLPDGLSVDPNTGVISGTATALGGPFDLTITVTDTSNNLSTSATTSMSVVDGSIYFTPIDQSGAVGVPFSYALTATGGTGIFTYATLDTLPDGLLLDNASGIISGVPTTEGTSALNFTATDSAGYDLNAPLNITIAAAPDPNTCSGTNTIITNGLNIRAHLLDVNGGVANGGQTVQYAQNTTTIVPPLTSADFYNAGNLATFTGINSNGICVADQITVTQGLTVADVADQTLDYGPAMTPVAVDISGGIAPYSVSVSGLAGLSFDGSNITGSSTTPGTFPVTIAVSDSNGQTRIQTISITVNPPPAITLGSVNVPATGSVGVLYGGSVAASGGYNGLTWSASGLPNGVSIQANGTISGTPTVAGTFSPVLTVTDSAGQTATVSPNPTITIAGPALSITSSSFPAGQVGSAYSATEKASGGYGSLTWSATGLPAGLTISASGVISGTPTTAATYNVVLKVKDSLGTTASVSGSITISAAVAGPSCTKPAGATGGLNGKGSITVINNNVITYKNSKGVLVTVTVPPCAPVQWNGGAKAFALGQTFEWNGYYSKATGNVAQSVTIN